MQTQLTHRPDMSWLDGASAKVFDSYGSLHTAVQSIVTDGHLRTTSPRDLVESYKSTAYYCARLNANSLASVPLRLYVKTSTGQRKPKMARKAVDRDRMSWIRQKAGGQLQGDDDVEEVTEHPALDLLRMPATQEDIPLMAGMDLLTYVQLYQEVTGRAYLLIEPGAFGPRRLWVLPSQLVDVIRSYGTPGKIIDYYEYATTRYQPEEIIPFRFPSLTDPYTDGVGPLQAMLTRIKIAEAYDLQSHAWLENRARPDGIVSPAKGGEMAAVFDKETQKRLEVDLLRHRRAGIGQTIVSKDPVEWTSLQFSPKDMGELADLDVSIEQIARAFDIPLSMINKDANRASAEEGRAQHAENALRPRCSRIDTVLTTRLIPLYDDSQRLFFSFDDPVTENRELQLAEREKHVQLGIRTINEERSELGLDPVDWGDEPWLQSSLVQPSKAEERYEQEQARLDQQREDALSARDEENDDEGGSGPSEEMDAGEKALRASLGKLGPRGLAVFDAARKSLRESGAIPQELVDVA